MIPRSSSASACRLPTRFGLAALALFTLTAHAQSDIRIPPALQGIDIVEHLGQGVPGDLQLVDETGRPVRLGQYFQGHKPLLLSLVYYQCPTLCHLVLNSLVNYTLPELPLRPGHDFTLLSVSFDPREGPAPARAQQQRLQSLQPDHPFPEWHFLTGQEPALRTLASALGFRYRYDPATGQYAHPAALFVLSPDRTITRYLYGLRIPPRDLKLALLEAAQGHVGTTLDRILLQCYRYDPTARRYNWYILGIVRLGSSLAALGLAVLLVLYWRREHGIRKNQEPRHE